MAGQCEGESEHEATMTKQAPPTTKSLTANERISGLDSFGYWLQGSLALIKVSAVQSPG